MRKLVMLAALVLVVPATAQANTPRWFVELQNAPAAEGTSDATLQNEHARFARDASGIDYKPRFSYRTLFNGIAIAADDQAINEIQALDEVAAVYPVGTATVDQSEPSLAFALGMTGADIAQSTLGITGRGLHVAVVDSGIDYDHPDLGGCFGRGCRVSTGYDLVGDDYDDFESHPNWQPVPHPDPLPDDCNGHGTHVAGIIGANGLVKGVAPEVTFGAYRVIGCDGGASTDVILAALERVYRDGADVLNLSIGEALNAWPGSPLAKASSRLVDKGIVVVAAAGNNRFEGLGATTVPGVGEKVIATASVENAGLYAPAFSIAPDATPIQYTAGTGSPAIPAGGSLELVAVADACGPVAPLGGKAALVKRTDACTFADKTANLIAAGAGAVVFYNDRGLIDGAPTVPGATVPVVYISQGDGELISARAPTTLTWGASKPIPNALGGTLSWFSSIGLAADLSLKPDIAAPGGLIRSTWPVEKGRYLTVSGTSMASPYVAGAAALYLQARPRTRAADVGPILQNSADPLLWSVLPASGRLEPIARQGAGLLDIDDAIQATTAITPGKLSLGDESPARRTLTVANDSRRTVTYSLIHADTLAVRNGPGIELPLAAATTVTFDRSTLTLRPGGRARVEASFTADPNLPAGAVYGGYLTLTPDAGPALRVPYAGYKGDYQALPALTPTSKGYPWLARRTGIQVSGSGIFGVYTPATRFTFAPTTFTAGGFTRQGRDAPVVLVHLENPADRLTIDVYRKQRRLGEAFSAQLIPRNAFEGAPLAPILLATEIPLDGTIRAGHRRVKLPDGEYRAVVKVQRALSGPVETWSSPPFVIDRA